MPVRFTAKFSLEKIKARRQRWKKKTYHLAVQEKLTHYKVIIFE